MHSNTQSSGNFLNLLQQEFSTNFTLFEFEDWKQIRANTN